MSEGTLRWWWVRHAPTVGPPDIIHGTDGASADLADPELIARVARLLPTDARAVTSTLARARETYAAFRSLRPLPPAELAADLNEQDFGAWTGGTWNALTSEAAGFWKDPVETAPPGGESYAAMCRRVHRWIEARGREQGDVIVVSHGGPIRAALALALDLSPAASLRFAIEPLSVTRIEAAGSGWRVVSVGAAPT